MDTGEEELSDEHLIERLRGTAQRINRRALFTALAITLLAFFFPSIKL